jgi:hypothetical protein
MTEGWGSLSDAERIAAVARSAECAGMTAADVAEYINTPIAEKVLAQTSVVNLADCLENLPLLTVRALVNSENYYNSHPTSAKAAAGLDVWAQLKAGSISMYPGTRGRTVVDAAVAVDALTVDDLNILVGLASQDETWCMVSAPLEQGGLGWIDGQLVTAVMVEQALEAFPNG